jgi:hypothetical protein
MPNTLPDPDPLCVCGHGAAAAHDIVADSASLRFGACVTTYCRCTQYVERLTYPGTCESCRAYWNIGQALAAEWYVAARADQPPISDQIRRSLVMYLEHAMAHTGLPTT